MQVDRKQVPADWSRKLQAIQVKAAEVRRQQRTLIRPGVAGAGCLVVRSPALPSDGLRSLLWPCGLTSPLRRVVALAGRERAAAGLPGPV